MSTEPGRPDPPAETSPRGPRGSEESVRESPGLFPADVTASGPVASGLVASGPVASGAVASEEPLPDGPPHVRPLDARLPSTGSECEGTRADWRRLLSGGPPRKLLARLVQGDPLGVRRLVGSELRASAVLLDADRVFLRALARCARHAARYQGRPTIEAWLRGQVSRAVREILREEDRALRETPNGGDEQDAHTDLARPLGLDPRATRAACDAFNRRPVSERRAFFRLLIEHASLEEVARETDSSIHAVARRARLALDAARGAAGTREQGGETR